MGSTASLLLLGAAIVAAIGIGAVWVMLQRPARALERRQRDEALAAAAQVVPAGRVPPYGPPPDPCAPGLSDAERVEAMRALLMRGDRQASEAASAQSYLPTQPMALRDAEPSTSPMAWNPTQPLEDVPPASARDSRAAARADHEHITI